jgi:ribosomal protein S18 acetylase RimI-like enzyme
MVVSPHFRRLGLGKRLLGQLLAHANEHNLSNLMLGATAWQTDAIGMYEGMGWIPVSEERLHAPLGISARMITFQKGLSK